MTNGNETDVSKKLITTDSLAFTNPFVRSLFFVLSKKWVGEGFSLEFLPRTEWVKKQNSFREIDEKGNEKLFIPEDVESEELIHILETSGKPKDERTTRRSIESPKNELASFLFQKGIQRLVQKMPIDSLPRYVKNSLIHWKEGQTTLCEAFNIAQLKKELNDVKKTGDVRKITDKEIEIADKIQMIVREYPFLTDSQHPAEMVENKSINCRGASILGGALLSEVGISYLVGDVPKHSILVLVLTNDTIEWRDMVAPAFNEFLGNDVIRGYSKTGASLSINDVLAYAKEPTPDGFMLDIAGDGYRTKLPWVKNGQRQFLTVFPPKLGSQMQILNGVAFFLAELGHKECDTGKRNDYFNQAVEACKLSTAYFPKYEYAYNTMGEALCELSRYEEAIDSFQQSATINQWNTTCHYGLGKANFALGRKNEALLSYRRFVELADPDTEGYWIGKARETINLILKDTKSRNT